MSKSVMKKTGCEDIRRELDELNLGDECSAATQEHLRGCAACSEFETKQTKLRQIVGGLGTVSAPPDFDFRLRARLANESAGNGAYHLSSAYWSFTRTAAAAFAALILFVGGYVLVRQFTRVSQPVDVVTSTPGRDNVKQGSGPEKSVNDVSPATPAPTVEQSSVVASDNGEVEKRSKRSLTSRRSQRSLPSTDYSGESAKVINLNSTTGNDNRVFPIDASAQSLRFSLDDGRGNARTISLPPVTFGSQRVLANGNQFAPKGVW